MQSEAGATVKRSRKVSDSEGSALKVGSKTAKILIYVLLILSTIVVVLPLIWLVSSSLKTSAELFQNPWALPSTYHFENYVNAWVRSSMGTFLRNSVIVAALTVFVTIAVSPMISYVLARMKFRFNHIYYYFIIAGMMVPIHSTIIPLYMDTKSLSMQNNLIVLALIYAAFRIPISVFILDGFMLTIPKTLEESAVIDGCGTWRIYFRIILPLCKEGMITVIILAVMSSWNELLLSMLMLTEHSLKTIPTGLLGFISEYNFDYTQLCAALVIACLPNVILYVLMSDKMVKGMTAGAVKG